MRGEVYVPRNGERFDIAFKNTHKQLKIETVPPLNKADRPGGKGIQELWAYLVDRPRKAGYTAEELLRIWSGRQDLEEKGVT
jgi:hypothetical protein